ncbi:28 kDa inner dynein arm light chain, axonemal [Tritrichomonas musculus]|uniref:28 kDa inner dynein arm light chain, axonemal n=1 Tax=Tritrichomonas musculus TaxID=1915356 RepID=A0ABR2KJH4_9EUKA
MSEKLRSSLLKYNVPVLSTGEKHTKKQRNALNNLLNSGGKTKSLLNSDGQQEQMLTRDVLNVILPPRQFNDNGQDVIQFVSTNPATKTDVIKLQAQLDKELQENKVREIGIDSVRSEIYAQCFDEIIRQVTIDCSARGLLLVRIRDEMKTTISKFQTLYESAITWGMRKAFEKEQNKDMLNAENESLKEQVKALKEKNLELERKIEDMQKREQDYRAQKEKEHANETAFLKRQAAQLKTQLEQTLK